MKVHDARRRAIWKFLSEPVDGAVDSVPCVEAIFDPLGFPRQVKCGVWIVDADVFKQVLIFGFRGEGSVGRLVADDEAKRTISRPLLTQIVDGHVGQCGSVVPGDHLPLSIDIEFRIEVIALPLMTDPVIKPRPSGVISFTHVPLPDVSRLIARRLKLTRVTGEVFRIIGEVVDHAVSMGVKT